MFIILNLDLDTDRSRILSVAFYQQLYFKSAIGGTCSLDKADWQLLHFYCKKEFVFPIRNEAVLKHQCRFAHAEYRLITTSDRKVL